MRNLLWLLLIVLVGPANSQPDVHLKVTKQEYRAIPIAIADSTGDLLTPLLEAHHDFLSYFKWAIEITGYAEIVNSSSGQPEAVVEIKAKAASDGIGYEIKLDDYSSKATIFRRRYTSSSETLRHTAYLAADDVIFALTGRHGIANTRIAFVAGKRSQSHLYVATIDGRWVKQVTRVPGIVMSPAWSPDGNLLAYVSYSQGKPDLYVTDITSFETTRFLAFEGLNATPAWSPDGRYLAVTLSKDGNPEIYVIATDGKSIRRVTFYSGIDCSPTWAPNGLELAFTSDRAGSPQIFVTDIEGISVRRLTHEGSYNTSPAWSPQGDLIAFVSRIDGRFQICTTDPFGTEVNVLTQAGNNEDPTWSPDGMHIAFSSTIGGKTGIYIMRKDGGGKRLILDSYEYARNPSWSGSAYSITMNEASR